MAIESIPALRWLTDLGGRAWNWHKERSNSLQIKYLSLDYHDAEIHPNTGELALIFGIQFAIENPTTELAEDVKYQVQVDYPQLDERRSRVPNTHVIPKIDIGSFLGRYQFEPLIVRTDFSDFLEVHDDPRNNIRAFAPFSGEVYVGVKVASSTHNGDEVSVSITQILRDWIARNHGKKIGELNKGTLSVYPRERPSKEHMELVIGEDGLKV